MNKVARIGFESVRRFLESKGWSCRQVDGKGSTRFECTKKNRQPVTIQVRTARMTSTFPFMVAKSAYNGLTENLGDQIKIPHVLVPLRLHDFSIEGYYPFPAAGVRRLAEAKFREYWPRGRRKDPNKIHLVCIHIDQLSPYRDRWDLIGID